MEEIQLETELWPDTGSRPGNWADISYTAGSQPIDEWDNYWNYSTSRDLQNLADKTNQIINRLPSGTDSLEDRWIRRDDPTMEGPLDLNGYDLIDGPRTVWNASNQHIQQSALQNEAVEIVAGGNLAGGGQVRLGQTVALHAENVVDSRGDQMSGHLDMEGSEVQDIGRADINSARQNHRALAVGGSAPDQELHSFATVDEYPVAIVDDEPARNGEYSAGIAFGSSADSGDWTPGASITFKRTGGWSSGEITIRQKEEEGQTGPILRRMTIQNDGTFYFYQNQLAGICIERRSNRPANADQGRVIFRTDRDTS